MPEIAQNSSLQNRFKTTASKEAKHG